MAYMSEFCPIQIGWQRKISFNNYLQVRYLITDCTKIPYLLPGLFFRSITH